MLVTRFWQSVVTGETLKYLSILPTEMEKNHNNSYEVVNMIDLEAILNDVKVLIKSVGKYQVENFNKTLEVEWKSTENDLVTNVDKNSEEKIIKFIKEKYPSHSIIGEEGANIMKEGDYRWIIDPLDGTNNFAHGFPIFTISIALEYKNEIVLGLIYYPIQDELFYAVKGTGAYLNGNKINVSTMDRVNNALLSTGFPYDKATAPDNNLNYLNRLLPQIRGLRRTGSAAYDLCNVARGSTDGYWELKLNLWDIAAGILIVEEAGGKVLLISNKENKYRLIAGNSKLVNNLLSELKKESDSWNNFL